MVLSLYSCLRFITNLINLSSSGQLLKNTLDTERKNTDCIIKTYLCPFIDGRKPTIIKAPVNQSAHIGSNVTFNCTVSGDPAPAVNWTKNGNLLPFNQKVLTNLTTGESQLVIRGVRMNDTGKYRCVASNSMGTEKSRAAALLVLGKVLH